MGVRQGLLKIRDFAADPGTFVVDIPAGYTVAGITAVNCGLSVSGLLRVRLSIGGVAQTIPIRLFLARSTSSSVVDVSSGGFVLSGTGTTGLSGTAQVWNFNTLAPVTVFFEMFNDILDHRALIFKSTVSQNQILIDGNNGGVINAGTIYVQLYKRRNSVVIQDFTADPLTNWDLTGLRKKSASAIVLSAFDLTCSVSTAISGRVSTDGVSFDDTAADYLLAFIHQDGDTVVEDTKTTIGQTPGTSQGLCSLFMGVPLNTRTLWMTTDIRVMATQAILSMGNREARQIEQALRIFSQSGTINGGTGYAVKYAL